MFWLAWQLLGVVLVLAGVAVVVVIVAWVYVKFYEWRHGKGIER